ncbi:basic secretory protein-like protein [Dactylosporangium sp. CA-052675]|uniref:basic secretory protein-like protein n=1 Tax=Dactylosporangium sp. CA-052675 TaxID=3239927 RepID=UPI003D8E2A7E
MVGDERRYADVDDVTATRPVIPHQRGDARRPAPGEAPGEPAPPRRGTVFRLALLASLAVLLGAPAGAIAYATARHERSTLVSGQDLAGAGDERSGERAGAKAGQPGAPDATANALTPNALPNTLDGRIRKALRDQAAALLGGDEDGFLRPVDPSADGLREDLARRFGSLRQLQVKLWQPRAEGAAKTEPDGTATVSVRVRYCYVVTTCDPMELTAGTRWKVTDQGVTLLEFGTAGELGPRPWEVSDLRTAIGNRVVMATTARYASRLPAMLAAAEQAAELTDTFARWGPPPARYVVYLAGPDEWASWYGMRQESWVIGFALPLTASATEIVLNANRVDTKQTLDTLRHEFTHVVTLSGVEKSYEHTWWLVEGIAEYVRVKGSGKPFDQMGDVRAYLRGGHWKSEVALDDPPADASTADVSGRYGVAYLSLQYLADTFGEDKLLEFFDYAARQGISLDDSARKAFGASWKDVSNDCARYVRGHV